MHISLKNGLTILLVTGAYVSKLFSKHRDHSTLTAVLKEIGIVRFIAPETGRYVVKINSDPSEYEHWQ